MWPAPVNKRFCVLKQCKLLINDRCCFGQLVLTKHVRAVNRCMTNENMIESWASLHSM